MWPILAAAAMGIGKGLQAHGQNQQRKTDLKLKAATQRYSPWSGIDPSSVQVTPGSNVFGNVLGGAATGYSLGSMLAPSAAGAATTSSTSALMDPQATGSIVNQQMRQPSVWQNMQPMQGGYNPYRMNA